MFAAMLGGWEVFAILAAILILFGSKKLPELAKGLGQGIREFKKATPRSDGRNPECGRRYSGPATQTALRDAAPC